MLQGARVEQEIGSHSFAHVLFGDPDLTREAVDSDLTACLARAAERGLTLRSFVFPRNDEGHHEALKAHGFTAYRGLDPVWYAGLPGPLRARRPPGRPDARARPAGVRSVGDAARTLEHPGFGAP